MKITLSFKERMQLFCAKLGWVTLPTVHDTDGDYYYLLSEVLYQPEQKTYGSRTAVHLTSKTAIYRALGNRSDKQWYAVKRSSGWNVFAITTRRDVEGNLHFGCRVFTADNYTKLKQWVNQ